MRPLTRRLAAVLRVVGDSGMTGATSMEIARYADSVAPGTDVADLRKKGAEILCRFEGVSESGRKVFRYWLVRRPPGGES